MEQLKHYCRGADSEALFKKVEVLPGEPANIAISTQGQAVAMEAGKLTASITITDAHGNRVEDGTPVTLTVGNEALIVNYEPATENGQVEVEITGNAFSVPEATLNVEVGAIEQQHTFAIAPLNVEFISSLETLPIDTSQTVEVLLTDPDGAPVADAVLSFYSDLGYFAENQAETDVSGIARITFNTGPLEGSGNMKVRASYAGVASQDFSLSNPSSDTHADTRDVMVIGDANTDGVAEYTRYDGTGIGVDYQTHGDIVVTGQANSTVTISLGDLSDPNIEPLAAYFMNQLEDEQEDENNLGTMLSTILEESGLYSANGTNLQIVKDHPLGKGKSYSFDGSATIEHSDISALQRNSGLGFRLDLKATQSSGQIFDLGGGQQLSFSGGKLRYEITTVDGSFAVESASLALNQWHSVAGRYLNGQLELQFDGVAVNTAASGDLLFASSDLTVGDSYHGNLNSLRFYDWSAPALLQLPNGTDTQQITLDGSGQATLTVQSTGQLGQLQSGSAIKLLRVAVNTDDNRQYVAILSKAAYTQLAEHYIDINSSVGPAVNVVGLLPANLTPWHQKPQYDPLNYMVPQAHAFELVQVGSFLKGALNFLVPIEEFGILIEQLSYVAQQDWENFDPVELAMAALGVATVVPIMKPLKPLLTPLKQFMRRYGNKPFVKHLAAVLGRASEEAVYGKTDKLLALAPYFMILAELAQDPEGIDAVLMIVDSVKSDDDLWAWINYLTLPTEGWDEDTPPSVGVLAKVDSTFDFDLQNLFIAKAYAVNNRGRRLSSTKLKNALKKLEQQLEGTDLGGVIPAIRGVTRAMKETDITALRKLVHDPKILGAAAALGGKAISKALKSTSNLRVSPLALAAIVTYIESRRGDCNELPGCISFHPRVNEKINTLYKLAFLNALTNNRDFVGGRENGAMFHLAMLAIKHLAYETSGGNDALKVVGIEANRDIYLYKKQGGRYVAIKPDKPIKRRVDIVLRGTQANDELGSGNVWVEVKSLKGGYMGYLDYWKPWNMDRSTYSQHRQFYLDRVGSANNTLDGVDPTHFPQASDYEWRFQQFIRRSRTNGNVTIRSLNDAELSKIRNELKILPKGDAGTAYVSLGKTSGSAAAMSIAQVQSQVKFQNLKTWITTNSEKLLKDYTGEVIQEFIEEATEF